ncbi:MAG: hypothetical protein MHM6MM_007398 [Cercozoa sp. M6MM]
MLNSLLPKTQAANSIRSFNWLIDAGLQSVVKDTVVQVDSFFCKFLNVTVGEPAAHNDFSSSSQITPHECRLRDMTYAAPLYVDVEYSCGNELRRDRWLIAKMPIMLRSNVCVLKDKRFEELAAMNECFYDPGGYFIVNGTEKVILIQEQLSKNRIILELDKGGNVCASVTSFSAHKSKTYVFFKNEALYVKHNILEEDIPAAIVLKAMGVVSDQEAVQLVGADVADLLAPSLQAARQAGILTQDQALKFIGARVRKSRRSMLRMDRAQQIALRQAADGATGGGAEDGSTNDLVSRNLIDEARGAIESLLLAHVPAERFDFHEKAIYLGTMLRRVLLAVQEPKFLDDKDYYGNKRLELAGQLLALLFEDLFKRFCNELRQYANHNLHKSSRARPFDIGKSIHSDVITRGLVQAISTGNWSLHRFHMERAGMTQVLNRLSFISSLGMMTRICSSVEKTRKVSGPRSLQPSQWGLLCPSDTPEGESCGLVKNLSLLSHVTTDTAEEPLKRLAFNLGVEDIRLAVNGSFRGGTSAAQPYRVFLNGSIVGMHRDPQQFVRNMRALRRRGKVGEFVSIYVRDDQRTVYLASDGGRVSRPLIIVEHGRPLVTSKHLQELRLGTKCFGDLQADGLVEYLDVNEENNAVVAIREEDLSAHSTHLEIDPMTILGIVASLIPFPHHNQSPRNTYQCAMGKQAMGIIGFNQLQRIDTFGFQLVAPQTPLVRTRTTDICGFGDLPAGQNATLAVMSYSGYDIEDAIVLNRASLDRGFGRCIVFKKFSTSCKRYPNHTADRIIRAPEHLRTHSRFAGLDVDGVARVGAQLSPNDVLVNKEVPANTTVREQTDAGGGGGGGVDYRPQPMSYKGRSPAAVDKVLLSSNEKDNFMMKVQMRETRRPELGDKFSSRHGQKGVCGMIVDQSDMPFTQHGVSPDIIMNPHGFPSRMTVGKMIELVSGKAAVLEGSFADATAFSEPSVETVGHSLLARGFSFSGKEILYSGVSGVPLKAYVFVGPVYYQKLVCLSVGVGVGMGIVVKRALASAEAHGAG